MLEWNISKYEIESTEKLLLPDGAHFSEDAKEIIRYWDSTDVVACPGSGKTTVLLAKLKLLADRMPLKNNSGICVLSHTNVAINEIQSRLPGYADKILGYPNFIGTIQSFIDKFVTLPYLRKAVGRNVEVVDDDTYANHMQSKMHVGGKCQSLAYVIKNNFNDKGQFDEETDYIKALYLRDGNLYVGKQKKAIAGANTRSVKEYNELIKEITEKDGVIRYKDAYKYAELAVNDLPNSYLELFALRFKYVFIDEYQDCDDTQRKVIDLIFKDKKCTFIKIGDPDQAIYNFMNNEIPDWIPSEGSLSLKESCRYSQEIANVICKLKKNDKNIVTTIGNTGIKPVLIVFDTDKIERVTEAFISVLESKGICCSNDVYKVVGAIKRDNIVGLKIGSYWDNFDSSIGKKSEYNYWTLVDEMATYLSNGKLYKAEKIVRKLLCRVFHYIKNNESQEKYKNFTITTIKRYLDEYYKESYRQWIWNMSQINSIDRRSADIITRQELQQLIKTINPNISDIFNLFPEYFMLENSIDKYPNKSEKNVFFDSTRGLRIVFDTIHGVKGETHDATLYLETEMKRGSDLSRILSYLGTGKVVESDLYDYSRKLAYVGMSRPRKILCVAMQSKTFEKSNGIFDSDWEIVDLRDKPNEPIKTNKS